MPKKKATPKKKTSKQTKMYGNGLGRSEYKKKPKKKRAT